VPRAEAFFLIGLIVPPADGRVPPEGAVLYPHLKFDALGLALPEMSPSGFNSVVDSIVEKAVELQAQGAEAISIMGTSLTFYRGAEVNRQLQAAVHDATKLPTTTMSSAVVNALRKTGVRRVGLATAYIDDLNVRLEAFLRDEGFDIGAVKGLALTNVGTVKDTTPDTLTALAEAVFDMDRTVEGILISCGGLLTLDIITQLESKLGVPVITSSPAGFWDVVRLSGKDATANGFGRLFQA
jgi:arylmalonate decarboxylase